jgi:myo-inositol-1(or 4)-monophosphatase
MIAARLAFAADLARRAGDLLRQAYGREIEAEHKGAVDLVTEYDLRAEEFLTRAIRQAYPADAMLAEEGGASGAGELTWVIDPLDGTTNFARGVPFFCVSIACVQDRQPVLGVVFDPMRDELFTASKGGGAALNGRALNVSQTGSLDKSLLVTGFPYDIRTNPENNLSQYALFAVRSLGVRRLGSAALDLAYVAAGRFDGFWEYRLSPWDFAAGMLIVLEAGGRVTRIDGGPDVFREPTSILATNGRIHEAMLGSLREAEMMDRQALNAAGGEARPQARPAAPAK